MHPSLRRLLLITSLISLLLAGCGTSPSTISIPATFAAMTSAVTASATPTPIPATVSTLNWMGMQYPADTWQAETVEDNFLFYGLLTNLALPHCQIMVLAEDPIFILDKVPEFTVYKSRDWLEPTREEKATNRLMANLLTVKDNADQEQLVYYEVFDKTGFFGHDQYRLGYFLVSRSSPDPLSCGAAFWEVLSTLQVDQWTPLPVGQG